MNGTIMRRRIVLVLLAALLTPPITQAGSPVVAKPRPRTVTRTFANPAEIHLPEVDSDDPVSATLYPSPIRIRGLKGKVRDVNLLLNDFTHPYPDDVQVLLVGPGGQTALVMGNVGGSTDAEEVTLRLDDEAPLPLPNDTQFDSGTFQPTAAPGSTDIFNPPAPLPSGNSALSVFDGTNPNGTWRLFVQDEDAKVESGGFAGGWALELKVRVKAKKKR